MARDEPDDLITQAEAARLRGVTRSAIGYLISKDRLTVYERFGVPFLSRSEVMNYQPLKPGPAPKPKDERPAKKPRKRTKAERQLKTLS